LPSRSIPCPPKASDYTTRGEGAALLEDRG